MPSTSRATVAATPEAGGANGGTLPASAPGAGVELLIAALLMAAGLLGVLPFSPTPWLLIAATVALRVRGPGWRAIGLAPPARIARTVALGAGLGVGYNFLSLYAIEPAIARLTSGQLPDVSVFRSAIGNEAQLAFWLALSWTLAAFMEEMVYRGWLMTRIAELGRYSTPAWVLAVVASSVSFGVIHLYQGPSGMIATGIVGLIFAGVYLATGRNLWAVILAHGFMDTTGFVMVYLGVYPGL